MRKFKQLSTFGAFERSSFAKFFSIIFFPKVDSTFMREKRKFFQTDFPSYAFIIPWLRSIAVRATAFYVLGIKAFPSCVTTEERNSRGRNFPFSSAFPCNVYLRETWYVSTLVALFLFKSCRSTVESPAGGNL